MAWVLEAGFARRPLVVMEDHLYHMTELLDRLRGTPAVYGQLTVICLDRPGPDTRRTVAEWLDAFPGLQVVAAVDEPAAALGDPSAAARFRPLPPAALAGAHRLCQVVAAAL